MHQVYEELEKWEEVLKISDDEIVSFICCDSPLVDNNYHYAIQIKNLCLPFIHVNSPIFLLLDILLRWGLVVVTVWYTHVHLHMHYTSIHTHTHCIYLIKYNIIGMRESSPSRMCTLVPPMFSHF